MDGIVVSPSASLPFLLVGDRCYTAIPVQDASSQQAGIQKTKKQTAEAAAGLCCQQQDASLSA